MPSGNGRWSGENSGGGIGTTASVVLALVVVVVAGAAAVEWTWHEIRAHAVTLEVAGGIWLAVTGTAAVMMAVAYKRGERQVKAQLAAGRAQRTAAAAVPARPAIPAAAPAVHVTHHHYDERHLTIHVTAAPAPGVGNAESIDQRRSYHPPAITLRQPVPGVVLKREDEKIRRS